ncbi:MAG: hypothetical protein ACRD3M_00525, partial [Thermoanaerobaculia bacterium]
VLAFLLDLLVPAAVADGIGLLWTAVAVSLRWSPAGAGWVWRALAAGTLAAFLLRDARGGRARRFLGLEARNAGGGAPGPWASIRRNLPLLVPGWNLIEAWPLLRDGGARRRTDRKHGIELVRCE